MSSLTMIVTISHDLTILYANDYFDFFVREPHSVFVENTSQCKCGVSDNNRRAALAIARQFGRRRPRADKRVNYQINNISVAE
jgi:hypothetical protein